MRPDHQLASIDRRGRQNLAASPDMRFDAFVDRSSDCHVWQGSIVKGGYGQFRVGESGSGMVLAHRYAYEREFGRLEAGAHVHQICGNHRCVRPDHLRSHVGKDVAHATARELEVLRAWVDAGMNYGATSRTAARLGLTRQSATDHLYELRRRLRVRTTREAVLLLDREHPGWRDYRTGLPGPSAHY